MVKIAFYTITGQTQRFINKTGLDAHRIEDAHPQYQMNDKYILILPSYQDFMMDSVVDFLTYKDNKENLLGLIGCGNRNFNCGNNGSELRENTDQRIFSSDNSGVTQCIGIASGL